MRRFAAGEAYQRRRAVVTFKHTGGVSKFGEKLVRDMVDNGYDREFGAYGFRFRRTILSLVLPRFFQR
jgi:error-prone DNA polymerase